MCVETDRSDLDFIRDMLVSALNEKRDSIVEHTVLGCPCHPLSLLLRNHQTVPNSKIPMG